MNNFYLGKQFSILGDSISTLEGYNPKGYSVFYNGNNQEQSCIFNKEDTWWGKVIDFFGGELLVNNSWSGSRVAKLPNTEQLFPSGCSIERTSFLHINSTVPDVIMIYLGFNDWGNGVTTEVETQILGAVETSALSKDDSEIFELAYNRMLRQIKQNYPNSQIWCCTLCETFISKNLDFRFPFKHAGIHLERYNDMIRRVTWQNKCQLIDLYSYKMPVDTIDGSHPNKVGMNTLATMIIRSVMGEDADEFLDCKDNMHEYKVVEQYTGGTRYVCSRCGKEKHKSLLDISFEREKTGNIYLGMMIADQYRVESKIAPAEMYDTFLVQDMSLNMKWSMKAVDKNKIERVYHVSKDRFLYDTRLLMQFDHPLIPKITDSIETDNYLFVFREYMGH